MKFAVTLALLLAVGSAAQAKLTPFDGTRQAKDVDVVSLYTGPAGAEMDHTYLTAPQTGISQRPGRCTLQTFVFTKMRLADACY